MRYFIIITVFFMVGCGVTEKNVTPAQESFLSFSGNTQNAQMQINNSEPIDLAPPPGSVQDRHYKLAPGKYQIKITRDGKEIYNEEVLIFDQQVFEIGLP